jgi:hypothetical protein
MSINRHFGILASVGALCGALSGTAQALPTTFNGLYNTGVDAAGLSVGNGPELHWCVFVGSSSTCDATFVYSSGGFPIPPWLAAPVGGASSWVTPFRDTNGAFNEVYTYRYQFTGVAGTLAARDAHDDELLGIELYDVTNSTSLGTFGDAGPPHSFGSWSTTQVFSNALVAANTYYIDYKVKNSGGGPTGLRVEFEQQNSVPVTSSLALAALALLLVGTGGRLRRG